LGDVEGEFGRHHVQRDFAQARRAVGGKCGNAGVVPVAEAHALTALQEFDAVEDTAAHIARALERIGSVAGDENGGLARLKLAGQPVIGGIAQQGPADGRNADGGQIEIDEAILGVLRLRLVGGNRLSSLTEGLRNLADGHAKAAHRAVAKQGLPIARLGLRQVELANLGDGSNARRQFNAESIGANELHRGARHAVAHDQHGDRRTAHDIHLRRALRPRGDAPHVLVDQGVHGGDDLFLRYADQDDRLLVVDQLETADHAIEIDADDDMDRFARIADGTGEVGVEIGIAEEIVAAHDRRDRRITTEFAESVRSVEQVAGLDLFQKAGKLTGGVARGCKGNKRQEDDGQGSEEGEKRGWKPVAAVLDCRALCHRPRLFLKIACRCNAVFIQHNAKTR